MDNENKENTPLTKKERLDLLGKKIAENGELIKENEKLKEKCYVISEKINFQTERNKNFKLEIEYKQKLCKQIEKTYKSIISQNPDTLKGIEEMKNEFIKKKLEEYLLQDIPEINCMKDVYDEDIEYESNEFRDLIYDHVTIIHTEYKKNEETLEKSEEKKNFRVSKKTDFKSLKQTACNYFDIENENDYVITDDAEALIYNDKLPLDEFFKNYSVLNNSLRLISLPFLKSRSQLIGLQEYRMKSTNKLNIKNVKKDINVRRNMNTDSSGLKIKKLFLEYPGLKPFILQSEDVGIEKRKDSKGNSKNIETSFFMIFALIIFFILNLISIYGPRDIKGNNLKIKYAQEIFNNDYVTDYKKLYSYLVEKIGFNFMDIKESDFKLNDKYKLANNQYIPKTLNVFGNDQTWFLVKTETDSISGKKLYEIDMKNLQTYLQNHRKGYTNFVVTSSFHFILKRVKEKTCEENSVVDWLVTPSDKCYEVYYNSKTQEDSLDPTTLVDPMAPNFYKDLFVFKNKEQSAINLDVKFL